MISEALIINKIYYEGFEVSLLRLDLLHPQISGNKWFKLKYNLQQARELEKGTILTFGGAFSNHIAAAAYACRLQGFKSIGIIRGEASSASNPTLLQAQEDGMKLHFASREAYRQKDQEAYLKKLAQEFPDAYLIPEGGDNALGQKGCEEILSKATAGFEHVFCAYGTGTTFRGMAKALSPGQFLSGVNVLKYEAFSNFPNTRILNGYHFGGYARHKPNLLEFKQRFEAACSLELDYVYTAKTAYAVFDLLHKKQLGKDARILMVHTGGLQGNAGYEARYNLKPSRQVNEPQG